MRNPSAFLERALRRDAAFVKAGHDPDPLATSEIADIILEHNLYDSDAARRWLVDRASMRYVLISEKLIRTIPSLIEREYESEAIDILSNILELDSDDGNLRKSSRAQFVPSGVRHEVEQLLQTPGLASQHAETWGRYLVRVLSQILDREHADLAKQYEGMSRSSLDYHLCYRYFQAEYGKHETWHVVTQAVECSLSEAVQTPEAKAFGVLADELVAQRWSLGICLPLVALHDCEETRVNSSWQYHEAIRLLCLPEIVASVGAWHWRRLLRSQLRPSLTREEQDAMVEAIRGILEDQRNLMAELSDFCGGDVLSVEEEAAIEAARAEREFGTPYDPRELRKELGRGKYPEESIEERWLSKWPHVADHNALKILADATNIDEKSQIGDVETSLFPRLDALTSIMHRPEIDSADWQGEILGWCKTAVRDTKSWYRLKHSAARDTEILPNQYVALLDEKLGWWEERIIAALRILKSDPPEGHKEDHSDIVSWSSNDPVACSLSYLDEVLAVEEGSSVNGYRDSFHATFVEAWQNWPSYTRGLAIANLRPYHWAMSEDLNELLVNLLRTETRSHQLEIAFEHLLFVGREGITELMRSLWSRIETLSDPSKIVFMIGNIIGDAVIRYRAEGEHVKELADISKWFEKLKTEPRDGPAIRNDLAVSILGSATSRTKSLERLVQRHAKAWLDVVTWGLSDWLALGNERHDDLPMLPLSSVREMRWERSEQQFLFLGLMDLILRVVQEAEIGAFYEVHYELRKLLGDEAQELDVKTEREVMRILTPSLFDLCRASAERVAGWTREGRTTNDLAYVFSLSGDNTSDLVLRVFNTAIDREDARRELAPVIDVLADAGLRDLAAVLRQKLRTV